MLLGNLKVRISPWPRNFTAPCCGTLQGPVSAVSAQIMTRSSFDSLNAFADTLRVVCSCVNLLDAGLEKKRRVLCELSGTARRRAKTEYAHAHASKTHYKEKSSQKVGALTARTPLTPSAAYPLLSNRFKSPWNLICDSMLRGTNHTTHDEMNEQRTE